MGTSNSIICPLRVFPTRTQPIFIAGTNDAFWKIFCTALGKQDWLADTRFATNADRVANRAILEPMIEEYFLEHTCDELLDKLIPAGMACSAAYRISEAMVSPHAKARGSVLEIDYPGVGPVKSANNPIKLSDAPVETRRKSPAVGEHTVEIMREVGYSDAEIANLKNAKAIAAGMTAPTHQGLYRNAPLLFGGLLGAIALLAPELPLPCTSPPRAMSCCPWSSARWASSC